MELLLNFRSLNMCLRVLPCVNSAGVLQRKYRIYVLLVNLSRERMLSQRSFVCVARLQGGDQKLTGHTRVTGMITPGHAQCSQ